MHSINRVWFPALLVVFASCSDSASALTDRFILCDEKTGDPVVMIDYQSLWTRVEDMESRLEFCNYERGCMIYPFVISEPPEYPSIGEAPVNWTIGDHQLVARNRKSNSQFTIEVSYPVTSSVANRRRETIAYDTTYGVVEIKIQDGDRVTQLAKCSGRLTFADIETARASDRPPTPDPPAWN